MSKPKGIVIFGPQGSGKGTQAEILCKKEGFFHLSTGDLLREGIAKKNKLALKMQAYMHKGELVPDAVIMQFVKSHLKGHRKIIFDGIPRTPEQAKALEKIANITLALELHISDKESKRRLSTRRVCLSCGTIFHVTGKHIPVCPCGGKPIHRDDDKPRAIAKRLQEYHKRTEPLKTFYEKKGLLVLVDGEKPVLKIAQELKRIVQKSL